MKGKHTNGAFGNKLNTQRVKKLILKENKLFRIDQIPLPNRSGMLLFDDARAIVKDFIQGDKDDRLTTGTYFWHRELSAVMAFDTPAQIADLIRISDSQGFSDYKQLEANREHLADIGVTKATIYVRRNMNADLNLYGMKPNGESVQDILSIAFGYIPAGCEETYVAVEF